MGRLERQLIRVELTQRREEGCDVADIAARVDAALADDDEDMARFEALYDELMALRPAASFPYEEPSELDAIRALRPPGPRRMDLNLDDDGVRDRIYGAWLGRAAGCSLGKPVEGWPRKRIDAYLESMGALPLNDYVPFKEGAIGAYLKSSTRGNIEFMARDDDMDYPILGLLALEKQGLNVTPRHLANVWLSRMPYGNVYTAESAAYRNFVTRRWPPESALWRNPYREWIGAQIRADVFGWVAPGWPERAAELAFRDGCISHVKNGIYGEMFVAAMLAASFVTSDVEEIIRIGLSEIPARCRLAEAVRDTQEWWREAGSAEAAREGAAPQRETEAPGWEAVWERIAAKYGHYSGVHTINNAALVVMGLLFGADDYQTGVTVTVRGGWDADCTGATVGSILGAKFGAAALPEKWVGVLGDRLLSAVRDCNDNRISELADRTHRVAQQMLTAVAEAEEEASSSAPSNTGGLPGTWRLDNMWTEMVLTVNANLSGKMDYPEHGDTSKVRDVRIDGDRVRFVFVSYKGEAEIDIEFDGKVAGDRLVGQCITDGSEFAASGTRLG